MGRDGRSGAGPTGPPGLPDDSDGRRPTAGRWRSGTRRSRDRPTELWGTQGPRHHAGTRHATARLAGSDPPPLGVRWPKCTIILTGGREHLRRQRDRGPVGGADVRRARRTALPRVPAGARRDLAGPGAVAVAGRRPGPRRRRVARHQRSAGLRRRTPPALGQRGPRRPVRRGGRSGRAGRSTPTTRGGSPTRRSGRRPARHRGTTSTSCRASGPSGRRSICTTRTSHPGHGPRQPTPATGRGYRRTDPPVPGEWDTSHCAAECTFIW
ncbi:hypothetical protein HDA37_002856 [Pseudonocardia antarctica]|uniref:Uncharacterized protein n=1 Tax=Pseudonocardia alni TaxID=33907 RepID=A0A852W597_PSEA5|nr:hypothetical protein [Pseudonocardia antarctica]